MPPLSEPQRLALEMIRLSPSFSRVSRVWETTQTFWEEVTSGFKTQVDRRLKLKGMFVAEDRSQHIGISHTYELKLGTVSLSIVCVTDEEFITVDNLQRVAVLLGGSEDDYKDYQTATNYVLKRIQHLNESDRAISIEEPTGYVSSNKLLGILHITDMKLVDVSYTPIISILKEPRTFMALVPAANALEIAQAIKKKYAGEIGKVQNRLPLTLGIVFASRRTPLPAILDTGRRMLKQPIQEGHWTVIQKAEVKLLDSSFPTEVALTLEKDGQTLLIKVRTVMGDEKTEDAWYPYWRVEKDKEGTIKPFSRNRQFTGLNGGEWVHVSNLQEGDVVHFMPSRLDFEFLDTAARRFEVSYEDGQRHSLTRAVRPYYLEQLEEFDRLWNILSNGLATSQIHNLIEIIETKRMEWTAKQDDITFQGIVRDALANANWKRRPDEDDSNYVEQAALNGQLADVVELHMQ